MMWGPKIHVKFDSQTTRPNLYLYLNFFLSDFDNFKRFLAYSIPVTGKLLESMSRRISTRTKSFATRLQKSQSTQTKSRLSILI
jgi:hypothetical protein